MFRCQVAQNSLPWMPNPQTSESHGGREYGPPDRTTWRYIAKSFQCPETELAASATLGYPSEQRRYRYRGRTVDRSRPSPHPRRPPAESLDAYLEEW